MKRRFTGNSERDVYETSPPTSSYIWQRALPRCRLRRMSPGRKRTRRGRCALLLLSPLGAQMTSLRACLVSGYPSGLDSRLLSRTDRALAAQSAPKLS